MSRISELAISAAAVGIALPYMLDGRWLTAILAGAAWGIWIIRPNFRGVRWSTIGFLVFVSLGSAGVYLGYDPLWLLTYFVVLLIAWDLNRFSIMLDGFGGEKINSAGEAALISAHLKRLGVITGVGWVLGAFALSLQISPTFLIALVLGVLVFLGLYLVLRHLGRESNRKV